MPHGAPVEVDAHAEDPRLALFQPTARYYRWGRLYIIESDDDVFDDSGERWKHVSFSVRNRLPDWEEIKAVRMQFFPPDAEVIQVLPPVDEYVNVHDYCLHLWWNKDRRLCPPAIRAAV